MQLEGAFPLDLERTAYSYIERPNAVILECLQKHVLSRVGAPRILDVGCGAGANARAVREMASHATIVGVEPNERAAALAREACTEVFHGGVDAWLKTEPKGNFDAVILSDVVEHIPDPVTFLRALASAQVTKDAVWIVSVPNYAVWYNRVKTLSGRFDYAWSGLYDRTHLRFFTRKSIRDLLAYVGLRAIEDRCTASLVQAWAPVLRKMFQNDVEQGEHLALTESRAFQTYQKVVEPLETKVCQIYPELLGFQIVTVARAR